MDVTASVQTFLLFFLFFNTILARNSDKAGQNDQTVLARYNSAPVTKITVKGSADLSLAAEVARIDITFSSSGSSYEEAVRDVTRSMHDTQRLINKGLPDQSDTSSETNLVVEKVIEDLNFPSKYPEKSYKDKRPGDEVQAQGFIGARISSVDVVRQFVQQVSSDPLAEIEWIYWDLKEDTRAKMAFSLTSNAMQDAARVGGDWAKVLSKPDAKLTVVEISEEDIWNGSKSNRDWRTILDTDAHASYQAPNVTMYKTIKCTFELDN